MPRGGKRPGSRRKKGVPNKVTAEVREAILKAFDLAGGVEYLCAVAREDPKAFCALLGKLIPGQGRGRRGQSAGAQDDDPRTTQRDQRAVACQNRTRTGTFAPGCGRLSRPRKRTGSWLGGDIGPANGTEQEWQELPSLRSYSSAYAGPIAKQEEPSAFDIVRRVREEATEG
jgi:hypothetical protein